MQYPLFGGIPSSHPIPSGTRVEHPGQYRCTCCHGVANMRRYRGTFPPCPWNRDETTWVYVGPVM